MRRSRPEAVPGRVFVALLVVMLVRLVGCARPGGSAIGGGPTREQPAALLGLWRMEPPGDSGALLVLRRDAPPEAPPARALTRRRAEPVAWWWVEQRRPDEAPRLCLHWRPGRHAADCAPFRLDTLAGDSGRVVRLTWGDRRFVGTFR